ncbi:MAG: hypothetical protein J0M24_27150 [Verrucomicrobia bacterium]|nr:hypothetical protein [Verrucomicrobiota bacterium]
MPNPTKEPLQTLLPLFIPTVQIPQGDGSVLVRPGKPIEWLTVKQFGQQVGLKEDSIYRKIGSDALPERFVDYAGPRKYRIRADAIEHFRQHWRAKRGIGA